MVEADLEEHPELILANNASDNIVHYKRKLPEIQGNILYRMNWQRKQLYNESIKDLCEPTTSARQLDVREAPGKGTFVAGAAVVPVASRAELEALIHKGNLYRTTEATNGMSG